PHLTQSIGPPMQRRLQATTSLSWDQRRSYLRGCAVAASDGPFHVRLPRVIAAKVDATHGLGECREIFHVASAILGNPVLPALDVDVHDPVAVFREAGKERADGAALDALVCIVPYLPRPAIRHE